jgi:hypothetical protein
MKQGSMALTRAVVGTYVLTFVLMYWEVRRLETLDWACKLRAECRDRSRVYVRKIGVW